MKAIMTPLFFPTPIVYLLKTVDPIRILSLKNRIKPVGVGKNKGVIIAFIITFFCHLKGGWLNDESPVWFGEYARVIKERFGDRVHDFITFNEPQVFVGCGYFEGVHAPGYKLSKAELLHIGHNVLKAHGTAVKHREDPSDKVSCMALCYVL